MVSMKKLYAGGGQAGKQVGKGGRVRVKGERARRSDTWQTTGNTLGCRVPAPLAGMVFLHSMTFLVRAVPVAKGASCSCCQRCKLQLHRGKQGGVVSVTWRVGPWTVSLPGSP